MSVVNRVSDVVERILNHLLAWLSLVLLTALVVQVVNRYILGLAWPFLQFLIPFSFVWITMLGSAVAVRHKLHFDVDLISPRLPPRARAVFGAVMASAVLAGGLLIAWTGVGFAGLGFLKKDSATDIPMIYTYCSILVGGILIVLLAAERLLVQIQLARGGAETEAPR
jgi:TRAP-type C4-dicarboxylate transport system permease small subunit